jgi:hypothetical protein
MVPDITGRACEMAFCPYTHKVAPDGSCVACPSQTRQTEDGMECANMCDEGAIVNDDGTCGDGCQRGLYNDGTGCKACAPWTVPMKDFTGCEAPTCARDEMMVLQAVGPKDCLAYEEDMDMCVGGENIV